MELPLENIRLVAQERKAAMIDFAQQIVSIPSLPGSEGDVAGVINIEMTELGYDEVWTDQAGNVIGRIQGNGGPPIMLNGHMDHVDVGPLTGWPYPPFDAKIINGELWGRASADMKGPVACMVYAASLFKQIDLAPPGDLYVTVAVMEEVGGVGTQHLVTHLNAQAAICGEPSNNTIRRGHRGRIELLATFQGRSAHAGIPHLGVNPHYAAASFLNALPSLILAHDETLGSSTVVPTLYSTDQTSPNVIPGYIYLTLDWRNVPGESVDEIVAKTQGLLDSSLASFNHSRSYQATAAVSSREFTTYTGMVEVLSSVFPSYILPEDNPFVQTAVTTLANVLGQERSADVYRFATDGGHLVAAGIPTVGFGPGDDTLAHTNQERIRLDQMEQALVGYVALTAALAEVAANQP